MFIDFDSKSENFHNLNSSFDKSKKLPFRTTEISTKIPIIFRKGTENYVTDQFKCNLIKNLKLWKKRRISSNYWELNLFHENGKTIKRLNEICLSENFLFASFNSFINKKQTLREMYLSSHIEKRKIRNFNKKKQKRGKLESKGEEQFGDRSYEYDNGIKEMVQRKVEYEETRFDNFGVKDRKNIRLLTKLKSRENAFSAIPCKEMKFKKKISDKESQRSHVHSVDDTSRASLRTHENHGSTYKSKGKSTFKEQNSGSKSKRSNKNDSLCANDTIELKEQKREFGKYLKELGIQSPPGIKNEPIEKRIQKIRLKNLTPTTPHPFPDTKPQPLSKLSDQKIVYSKIELSPSPPTTIEYAPNLQPQNPRPTPPTLTTQQASIYEKILLEMVEIENLINLNKIMIHYNLLENWSNCVIAKLHVKQEQFRINKYQTAGFSPHTRDFYDQQNLDKFKQRIEMNKVEVFAVKLKKHLRDFYSRREKYFGEVKPKSKNLFDHALVLGTLKEPKEVLSVYEGMKGGVRKKKEPRVNVSSIAVGINRNKIVMRRLDKHESERDCVDNGVKQEFQSNFIKYMLKSKQEEYDHESLQTPECQIRVQNHSSIQTDLSAKEEAKSPKILHQVYKGHKLQNTNHTQEETVKPEILSKKETQSICNHFKNIENLCSSALSHKNIIPSPNSIHKITTSIISNLDPSKKAPFLKTWSSPTPTPEDLLTSIKSQNSTYISQRCTTFLSNIKKSELYKGKLGKEEILKLVKGCMEGLGLEYFGKEEGKVKEGREQEFEEICEEFLDCLYYVLNLPPFHYPRHVLLDNDSYAEIDVENVLEPMVHRSLSDGQFEHHGLLVVFCSILSEYGS